MIGRFSALIGHQTVRTVNCEIHSVDSELNGEPANCFCSRMTFNDKEDLIAFCFSKLLLVKILKWILKICQQTKLSKNLKSSHYECWRQLVFFNLVSKPIYKYPGSLKIGLQVVF